MLYVFGSRFEVCEFVIKSVAGCTEYLMEACVSMPGITYVFAVVLTDGATQWRKPSDGEPPTQAFANSLQNIFTYTPIHSKQLRISLSWQVPGPFVWHENNHRLHQNSKCFGTGGFCSSSGLTPGRSALYDL